MRILIIEDNQLIGAEIQTALKDSGYAADWLRDGGQAETAIKAQVYALLLLDLGLPNKDGLSILKSIRETKSTLPVIIITARDDVEDRIKGLDYGADDYLVKPFLVSELEARIRAVIRRHEGQSSSILSNDKLRLNLSNATIEINHNTIELSAREFTLMRLLLMRAGKILSRDELEDHIYGWNEEVASNAIEFIIHGLRKKLGKETIKNIRGLGWMVNQ